jgi:hypothetical protein
MSADRFDHLAELLRTGIGFSRLKARSMLRVFAIPVGSTRMTSRHFCGWLALVAASLALITSSVHGVMAHMPAVALDAPALSADVAAGHGRTHAPEVCGACLAASQARGALPTQAKIAAAPRPNADLLAPSRVATFAARFSNAPGSPRAPPVALSI